MWIEHKEGLAGPARVGRVTYSKSGASLSYRGQTFRSLKGQGYKANCYDVKSGEEYWISGCHRDGEDALYSTTVQVDEEVLEEYWVDIRSRPDLRQVRDFRAVGKCR
jgi:hypothetical protein